MQRAAADRPNLSMTIEATARPILRTEHVSGHPWPADCYIQGGGSGLVFSSSGSYNTAFVEAFPRNPNTFIRGEGATVEEADDAAWAKFERYLACPEHMFSAGSYRNGCGTCTRCGMFGSMVFTAEQLGRFCGVCATPTLWASAGGVDYCEEHAPSREAARAADAAIGLKPGVIESILEGLRPV